MGKLKLQKDAKCFEFKYRGKKFLLIENELDFLSPGFSVPNEGITVLFIDSKLKGIKRSSVIHRLVKQKKVRKLIPTRCKL